MIKAIYNDVWDLLCYVLDEKLFWKLPPTLIILKTVSSTMDAKNKLLIPGELEYDWSMLSNYQHWLCDSNFFPEWSVIAALTQTKWIWAGVGESCNPWNSPIWWLWMSYYSDIYKKLEIYENKHCMNHDFSGYFSNHYWFIIAVSLLQALENILGKDIIWEKQRDNGLVILPICNLVWSMHKKLAGILWKPPLFWVGVNFAKTNDIIKITNVVKEAFSIEELLKCANIEEKNISPFILMQEFMKIMSIFLDKTFEVFTNRWTQKAKKFILDIVNNLDISNIVWRDVILYQEDQFTEVAKWMLEWTDLDNLKITLSSWGQSQDYCFLKSDVRHLVVAN